MREPSASYTAYDQQALRYVLEFQRTGRVHEARIVVGKTGDSRNLRAGRNNAAIERDGLGTFASGHFDHIGRGELRHSGDDLHFALLGESGQSFCTFRDDVRFPRAQRIDVDLRLLEFEAEVGHLFRFRQHAGSVQQRFGRNTADVEANATEIGVAFDQNNLLAEIRRAKRSGVASGA